jgi:transmembrane serine protease 3
MIISILLSCICIETLANAILPEGGTIEHVAVYMDKLDQNLMDLGQLRISINYSPMSCEVQKYRGSKFYGILFWSTNGIESEDVCLSVCWQFKTQTGQCNSVNYIAGQKKCELMQDWYSSGDQDFKSDQTSAYIRPLSCSQPGQPVPPPVPAPQPSPSGGNVGNIRPGSCGQTSVPQRVSRAYLTNRAHGQRIVGGNEARPHSIPWIVSLRRKTWHFCGGTLLRVKDDKEESDIVVTAAHCTTAWFMNNSVEFLNVVSGAHSVMTQVDGEQWVEAAKMVVHPGYDPNAKVKNNDISIVKLAKPIKFTNYIQPACLPAQNEMPAEGTQGIVAGWGALKENGVGPDNLNQVVVPVVGGQKCKEQQSFVQPDTMLCAGYDEGGKDSCQGDSGGPYVTLAKKGYTLHGVVSFGNGCARAKTAGVYARVTNYIPWIQQQIRALSTL